MKLQLKRLSKAKPSRKLDLKKLRTTPKVKEDFVLEVSKRFQALAEMGDLETNWSNMQKA